MAKKETLELDVKVKGAGDVDDLADSLGDIEDASRKAQGDLDDLFDTVKKLTSADAEIVLAIKAGQVKTEIDDIRVDLATMKSTPAEIEIKIARLAELTGDLDTLTGKIKEIDAAKAEVTVTADTSGATKALGAARGEVDKIPRSVGGANSALANMYGNVAGEAGTVLGAIGPVNVAIGQMAEYAADARFEGEKLGSALGSMAKIAGPVAALSLALSAMSEIIGGIKAEKAFNDEQVKTFTDAIRDGQTAAEALRDVVAETGELMIVQATGGGFAGLGEQAENLIPVFNELGISYEVFMDLVNDPSAATRWVENAREIRGSNRDLSEDMLLVADAVATYQENIGAASDATEGLNEFLDIAPRSAQATLEAFQAMEDPISRFPDQWDNIMEALRTGEADTEAAADALEILSEQLNKDPSEIWAMGATELERRTDAVATAMGEMKEEVEADQAALEDLAGAVAAVGAEELERRTGAVATAMGEMKEKVEEDQAALEEMNQELAAVVATMDDAARRSEAYATALDGIDDASELDHSGRIIAFAEGVHGVGDALDAAADAGVDFATTDLVPDTYAEVLAMPDELKAIGEAFTGLRETAQADMERAFSEGGAQGLKAWAADARKAVTDEIQAMGLDAEDEVVAITEALEALGLTEEQIDVVIATSGEEQARAVIDNLSGLIGSLDPTTQLAISVLTETDPIAALKLTIAALEAEGVLVPVELYALVDQFDADVAGATEPRTQPVAVDDEGTLDDYAGAADEATADRTTHVIVPKSPTLGQMQDLIDHVARARTVNFNSKADNAGQIDGILDGVAAQRYATITAFAQTNNAEYQLNTVARDRTADIWVVTHNSGGGGGGGGGSLEDRSAPAPATVGLRGVAAPAAQPATTTATTLVPYTVAPAPRPIVVNVNAAVIGSRYDVQRAVTRALRNAERLGATA